MKKKIVKILAILSVIVTSFISCQKDKDAITPKLVVEEELITTLKLTFTSLTDNTEKIFLFRDIDGPGGKDAIITTDSLLTNSDYLLKIDFYNEAKIPTDTITSEILNEGDLHQLFFQSTTSSLKITYDDKDANNKPIGLLNKATTLLPTYGKLTVTLRHKLDKNASGVSSGNLENAKGDTDIEVIFLFVIK